MKKLTEQLEAGNDQADLTPLIDCVFLLLLFFIVTAVFVEESNLFQVELAEAEHSQLRKTDDAAIVWISSDGRYAMDQQVIPHKKLYAHLKSRLAETPFKTIVIKGDRQSPLEKTVHVFEIAKALDIPEVLPAVQPEGQ